MDWLIDQDSEAGLLPVKAKRTAEKRNTRKKGDEQRRQQKVKRSKKCGKEEMILTCCTTAVFRLCEPLINAKHDSDLGGQPQSWMIPIAIPNNAPDAKQTSPE